MNNNNLKTSLTLSETITITSMLFGMFFGAGNLIFPVYMGQMAGSNVWPAIIGFIITGVGLPLLGVAALGISKSNGLQELSSKVSRRYGVFFTCALYLTIGPLFAIPRCATVPFEAGVVHTVGNNMSPTMALAIFSGVFFIAVLAFSLKPGKIMVWIGKILNPLFLCCLAIFVISAFLAPGASIADVQPEANYQTGAFFNGFLEGYNTLDALASLAFGIVVINVIKGLGIERPEDIATNTVKAGIFSCIMMGVIYICITVVGVQSRGFTATCSNGAEALYVIANHYFGGIGALILAATVTFACLKTAVGLTTSCAQTFTEVFPKGPSYKVWAIIFTVVAFLIANLGLNTIISYSLPVLMFLYPLAITLILLALFGKFYNHDKCVYASVTGFTLVAAFFDLVRSLPAGLFELINGEAIMKIGGYLPFSQLGMGWIVPAIVGLVLGLIIRVTKKTA